MAPTDLSGAKLTMNDQESSKTKNWQSIAEQADALSQEEMKEEAVALFKP